MCNKELHRTREEKSTTIHILTDINIQHYYISNIPSKVAFLKRKTRQAHINKSTNTMV